MTNLLQRASQFGEGVRTLTEWLGAGAITVDRELAQKRANICLACPMNQPESMMTEAIAQAIKRQVEIKNRLDLRVIGEKSLHTCTGCGCVSRLKIWLPLHNIKPDAVEIQNFDPKCWLKHETP